MYVFIVRAQLGYSSNTAAFERANVKQGVEILLCKLPWHIKHSHHEQHFNSNEEQLKEPYLSISFSIRPHWKWC